MGIILPIVAVFVLLAIGVLKKIYFLPLLLIFLGGGSNYIDRVQLGYVRDPLLIGAFACNLSDITIGIGVVWAIWVYAKG